MSAANQKLLQTTLDLLAPIFKENGMGKPSSRKMKNFDEIAESGRADSHQTKFIIDLNKLIKLFSTKKLIDQYNKTNPTQKSQSSKSPSKSSNSPSKSSNSPSKSTKKVRGPSAYDFYRKAYHDQDKYKWKEYVARWNNVHKKKEDETYQKFMEMADNNKTSTPVKSKASR